MRCVGRCVRDVSFLTFHSPITLYHPQKGRRWDWNDTTRGDGWEGNAWRKGNSQEKREGKGI